MSHPALKFTDHRPWPIPRGRWIWRQSWRDLLFAHWPVPAPALRSLVPAELNIQEFEGTSWIGVVPFRMTGIRRRPLPELPGNSAFPELNVRLYVERDGKPGVWFLSLDASNSLAVWVARRYFHLPYWRARISLSSGPGRFEFESNRINQAKPVHFKAAYRPVSLPYRAEPGTLEYFLFERYCLYTQSPGGIPYRAEVHHVPWPLQRAEGAVFAEELLRPLGIQVDANPSLLHYSRGVDSVVWPLERLCFAKCVT